MNPPTAATTPALPTAGPSSPPAAPTGAPPPEPDSPPGGHRRRRRAIIGSAVAAAVVLGGLVAVTRGDDSADLQADAAFPTSLATVQPSTTSSAVATTTAPPTTAAPKPATTAPLPVAPVVPGPFGGPINELALGPDQPGQAVVATATAAQIQVYREPLTMPSPPDAAWTFGATTQFGSPTVFLVTGTAGDFLRVLLPIKPNGTQGWVHNSQVALAPQGRHVVVDVANRQVTLYEGRSVLEQSVAVVGKGGTPTPTGTYYITDLLRTDDPGGVYGPYVLTLSARSDSFEIFNGGEPIVAFHGTNRPDLLGTAASAGCIRLPNDVATRLVSLAPPGTPVYIR